MPSKPQSVIIERWLPYAPIKRKVIFQKINMETNEQIVENPKNVIIQWTAPDVKIRKEFKYLGIIRANPIEYIGKFKNSTNKASYIY